jgi:hypothetical protein
MLVCLSVCLSLVGKSSDINFRRVFAHNEYLHVSYRSLNVIRQDVIGGEGGVHGTQENVEKVASMGHKKMHRKLIVKLEGRRPLGRSRHYEDNIKSDPNKTGC